MEVHIDQSNAPEVLQDVDPAPLLADQCAEVEALQDVVVLVLVADPGIWTDVAVQEDLEVDPEAALEAAQEASLGVKVEAVQEASPDPDPREDAVEAVPILLALAGRPVS